MDVVLMNPGISLPRFEVQQVAVKLEKEGIMCDIVHVWRLKPFELLERYLALLSQSRLGLVIDASFEVCGVARSLNTKVVTCLKLSPAIPSRLKHSVKAPGSDKTKCLCPPCQNKAPDATAIHAFVNNMLGNRSNKEVV